MNFKNLRTMGVGVCMVLASCGGGPKQQVAEKKALSGEKGEVRLITLDPGHFHAALVQKKMYDQVNPEVYVFAPEGNDVLEHLKKIEGYNGRKENPTQWKEIVYKGQDYLEQMLAKKPGNVVVLAGNNRIKTEYIKKSIEAGLNVLGDKPMVITPENFPMLEEAFQLAAQKGVLLYDIMTERHEITTMIQKELSHNPAVFGSLLPGTVEQPGVEMVSVHYFYKSVSGNPLVRPAWFFDVRQQGEGIVDVATHLVDLIQWSCFPEVVLQKSDVEMLKAKRWPTVIAPDEFKAVTGLDAFPEYLKSDLVDGKLNDFANGEMIYKLRGIHARVVAEWRYKAPEGAGDTHYAIFRGSVANLEIKQGPEEKNMPTLYVRAHEKTSLPEFAKALEEAILKNKWHTGLSLEKIDERNWKVIIPDQYKVGHEAHFSQVTEKFLEYLKAGKLPEWEVPGMIVKYYTTMEALKMAKL
ncbi:MAG: oxidoreductase [Marinilabiliales bacterium]|nr:oxidoreductase [Marinilabiliales bacterium]